MMYGKAISLESLVTKNGNVYTVNIFFGETKI